MNDNENKLHHNSKKLDPLLDTISLKVIDFLQLQKIEEFINPDHSRKLTLIKTMDTLSYVIMNLILHIFRTNPDETAYVIHNDDLFDVLKPDFLDSFSNKDNEHSAFFKFGLQEALHVLTDQLIFDILYVEYLCNNNPHLTLIDYCNKHARYNLGKVMIKIKKRMELKEKKNKKIVNNPETPTEFFFKCLNEEIDKLSISTNFIKLEEKSYALENIRHILTKKINEKSNRKKEYSSKCFELLEDYLADFDEYYVFEKERDALYRNMINHIRKEKEMMNDPILREGYLNIGFDPDKLIEDFFTLNKRFKEDEKKPKYIWDYFYYHSIQGLIVSKPFKRNFRRDKNILYQKFIDDFKRYDSFVESILPKDTENEEDYFNKFMEIYYLERYNKLDYIFKLAVSVKNIDLTGIENDRPLVEMLCKGAYWPNLCKLFEEKLYERYNKKVNNFENIELVSNSINKLFSFKTAVYELFKLRYVFVPNNYDEIHNFLRIRYNIQSFHVKDKDWSYDDRPGGVNKILINNVVNITKALFPEKKVKGVILKKE